MISSNLATPKKYMKQDDGRAIPMVNYDMAQGKFIINKEAEDVIKGLESPLGVISVAGMYRTGKSYLLNRMLLNRSGGFSVGPSINPCTKGLWMWNKPIPAYTPDGQPINVLIIDTEGIGATDEDHNHDNKIMTLAILLSSYFIFNSLGTIDENAIQNLSFIVNITKNIQQKNNSNKFNLYLPSFMWVIRDFSLQLKGINGEPITSKEYLERSLELQKGTSEFIQSKNQIRSLVKEYFKDRDCVTLVRPLTEEGNLQNLEKVDSSKLRKEFIDQVAYLRKTVLNSIKPKRLNDQMLNGEMFLNLVNSYVQMINKGAVPVIQTAWTYMCQNECARAQESSTELYSKKSKEIEQKFPLPEAELKELHKQYKQAAIENYTENAIGDFDHEKLKLLKKNIKEIKKKLFEKNFEITKENTKKFLAENFQEISDNVEKGNYKSVTEYKNDIDHFISYTFDKCPNGPNRDAYVYEFIIGKIMEHSTTLSKNNINEMQSMISSNKSKLDEMTQKMNSSKAEFDKLTKELNEKKQKLEKLLEEKDAVASSAKADAGNAQSLIDGKNQEIAEAKKRLLETDNNLTTTIQKMKKEVELAEKENHAKDLEHTEVSSNIEKNKVLMEQKITNLEKTLKKLKEATESRSTLTTLKSKIDSKEPSIKEKISKYESQIKKLNADISDLQDKNIDLETKLLQKGKRIENEKLRIEEMLNEYEKKLCDIKQVDEALVDEIKNFKAEALSSNNTICSEYEKEISDLMAHQSEMDKQYSETENQLRIQLGKQKSELSLLLQEYENLDKKFNDLKLQNQNEKEEYDKYIKILEENNKKLYNQFEESQKELATLKTEQSAEIDKLMKVNSDKEAEMQAKKTALENEFNELVNEFNLKIKNLNEKLDDNEHNIIPKFKEKISELESQIQEFKEELSSIEKTHKDGLEEINFNHDTEIQDILAKTREEIEEKNNQNEKAIDEIRKCAELEKEEIDKEIKEDAEETKMKLGEIEQENEEKLSSIEKEKNAIIDELQDNLDEQARIHQEYVTETDQDMALKMQQIESLTNFIQETKRTADTIKQQNEESQKNYSERLEKEKAEISTKIEEIIKQNQLHQTEIENLENTSKELEERINEVNEAILESKESLEKEKNEAEEKIKELTNQLTEKNNEYASVKASYEQELSLKQQQIEFNTEKLEEIKKQLEEFKATFEAKIAAAKEAIIKEYTEKIENMQKEKEEIETILIQLKKQYKELEEKFRIETEKLNKENEAINQKIQKVTQKKEELSQAYEKEKRDHEEAVAALKTEFDQRFDMLTKESAVLQDKLKKIEADYQELNAVYEKESMSWQSKFNFLEDQTKMAKQEFVELKQKYEINLDDLQKKILAERERLQGLYNESLAKREEQYNDQIQKGELLFHQKYKNVYDQNKNLLTENKALKEKLAKYESSNLLQEIERKLKIALETEEKLTSQLSTVISTKDAKIEELKNRLAFDRENNAKKLADLESKLQEYEGKRTNLAQDMSIQKATGEKNKENKVSLIQSLKEQISELTKVNMKLKSQNVDAKRENEHIRKSSRNSSVSHGSNNQFVPKYKLSGYNSNKENLSTNYQNTEAGHSNGLKTIMIKNISETQPNA